MRVTQQLRGWHAGDAHQGLLASHSRLPRGQRVLGVRCDAAQPGPGSTQPYTAATVSGTAGVLPQQQAPHTDAASSSSQGVDYFRAAGHRLERLLAGVGDGEDEFFDQMILEQSPEQKLLLSAVAGGVLTGGALFLCWLCQLDPLGEHLELCACHCQVACACPAGVQIRPGLLPSPIALVKRALAYHLSLECSAAALIL